MGQNQFSTIKQYKYYISFKEFIYSVWGSTLNELLGKQQYKIPIEY